MKQEFLAEETFDLPADTFFNSTEFCFYIFCVNIKLKGALFVVLKKGVRLI